MPSLSLSSLQTPIHGRLLGVLRYLIIIEVYQSCLSAFSPSCCCNAFLALCNANWHCATLKNHKIPIAFSSNYIFRFISPISCSFAQGPYCIDLLYYGPEMSAITQNISAWFSSKYIFICSNQYLA